MTSTEDLQSQLEEAMEAAELYAEQLAEKDDEIAEIRERCTQLEDELTGEGRGGDLEMRDELRDLRARLEQAEDQLEKSIDTAKEQENRARGLDHQNKALKMEKLKLESELQRAQEHADALEENVQNMRQRTEQAAESEGRLGERERTHKRTLIKALAENEELHQAVGDLETYVQTLYQAINEKDEKIKEIDSQRKVAEQSLQDTESEVVELKRLLEEKELEITTAHEEINAVGELEVEIEDRVKTKVEKWNNKLKTLQNELIEERNNQAALQAKYDSVLLESGLREVEQQLVSSEEKNKSLNNEVVQLKQLLEQAEDDMNQLAAENENLKTDQGKFIDIALEKELAEIERLRHVISSKDSLLEEERARYRDLYEEKGSLEEELQDRDFTLAEYERGHGLTEAVLKQKQLKGDIKRRDKEIRRLNQLLSERIAAHEKLYETCRRLKKKAGLPEHYEFDKLELEEGMRGQTERLHGLVKELEAQNEMLEDERLRLLEALRKNAQNLGDKGMKFYGLTAEQVMLVNEFAENLKDGRVALPLNDRSLQLQQEVKDLKTQLRDVQRDLAAAELQLENGPPLFGDSSTQEKSHTVASPSRANQESRSPQEMEKHFERIAEEQASMMTELKLELQHTLASALGARASDDFRNRSLSAGSGDGVVSPKHDPKYERLMNMLQSKLEAGQTTALDRDQVESMRNELERQSEMNNDLIQRLQDAEAVVAKLTALGSPQQHHQHHHSMMIRSSSSSTPSLLAPQGQLVPLSQQVEAIRLPTRAGRALHNQQVASMRLPPEEWADTIILLNKRLVFCMDKLLLKEKETEQLYGALRESKENTEASTGQVALLYRQHLEQQASWEVEMKSLQKEVEDARTERDALRAKARRLDTLCAVLEGNAEAPRNHVKELTQRVALLEVNEVVLARRYNLIAEEERQARQERDMLKQEMIQVESTLRERVLYLEEWKAGAQASLESLCERLDACVPREMHSVAIQKLTVFKHKYRELLARESQLRSRTSGSQALRRRVHDLETELELVRNEARQARQESTAAREQVAWLEKSQGDSVTKDSPVVLSDGKGEELIQQVAQQKGELLEKGILLESTIKKSAILERRVSELTKELQEESSRADQAELTLESSRNLTSKVEEELSQLRDAYHGGASREEKKALNDRVTELEDMFASLSRENHRYRELADIASTQVQAFEMNYRAKEQELDALREQLREANSRSDDDAIIGKVQHELTSTKVSYQLFVRKYEMAKATLRRNELELRKLESIVDEKDLVLRQTREQARARILALEGAMQQVGIPTSEQESNVSTQSEFALEGMERLSETISRLGEAAEHAEEALRRSEASRRNLEVEVEQERLNLDMMRSVVDDLKLRVLAPSDENTEAVDGGEHRQDLAKRLLELNEALKATKLESMRQKRELQLVREEKAHIEKLRERDEEHMARLEEAVANTENALRRREDDKALRVATSGAFTSNSFGIPIVSHRAASRAVGQSSSEEEPTNSMVSELQGGGEGEMPGPDYSDLVKELQDQLRRADLREDELRQQLEKKSTHVRFLRKRLRTEGIAVDESADDFGFNGNESPTNNSTSENDRSQGNRQQAGAQKYYEADARKLQTAAQQTVASLKDMLQRKNQVVDGLKKKIEHMRTTNIAEREKDQAEIERLTEKLFEDNQVAIHKLRSAYENITGADDVNAAAPVEPDQTFHRELIDRLEEADVILERKDRRVLELEQAVEELRILRQKAENKAGQNAQIAEQLREKIKLVAQNAQAEGQQDLVKQLRGQIIAKDKKLSGLRAAVIALKNEFLKSEEEHEEELILKDREIASIGGAKGSRATKKSGEHNEDTENRNSDFKQQIDALKKRVEKAREDLDATKEKEEKLKAENKELRRQLREQADAEELQEESVSQSSVEVRKLQRHVRELKKENIRLKESLSNFGGGFNENSQGTSALSGKDTEGKSNEESGTAVSTSRALQSLKLEYADLERKLRISQAQNTALRSAVGGNAKQLAGSPQSTTKSSTATWEATKALEKRVTMLTKRLEERNKELVAAKEEAAQARSLLERASKDRNVLQKRATRPNMSESKPAGPFGGHHNHASAASGGSTIELKRALEKCTAELRHKEDVCTELRRRAEVQLAGEIHRLKGEVDSSRSRILELEDEVDVLRSRQGRTGEDSLELAENQYAREDELRQQLSHARKTWRALEAKLLERDNTILELRFELEQEGVNRSRLEGSFVSSPRRDALNGEGKENDSLFLVKSAGDHQQLARRMPGERFKRERDLENVVDSLKKVVNRLQSENDRLKRTSGGTARLVALQKQVKKLRTEKEDLDVSNQSLSRRLNSQSDISAKVVRLEDANRALKRQTKEQSGALERCKIQLSRQNEENLRLREELDQASSRLSHSRDSQSEQKIREQQALITSLQLQLGTRTNAAWEGGASTELESLRNENERLLNELNAFDLDFFEEIEDLKYKYQQSINENKQLRARLAGA